MKKSKLINKIIPARKIVNEYSLYPDLERKSKLNRYLDWYRLRITRGAGLAKNYNKYGLDIKNFHDYNDYIDGGFIHTNGLSKKIKSKKYNYITADKFLTYCYLSQINPDITPKVINLLKKGKSVLKETEHKTTQSIIESLKEGEKLCFKLAYGHAGVGFFLVEKENNEVIINNGKYALEDFYKNIEKQRYIVQEFVTQHKDMAKLNPSTLNTIRMVTVLVKGKYKYLGAMLRCGSKSKECVDNACNGGIFIGVNDDGTLKEDGFYLKRPTSKQHPVTNITFKGYKIPYFKESVELIESYHKYFPGLKSIGWDIAITDKGPIIIELNVGWQTSSVQMCNGGLRNKIEELYNTDYKSAVKSEKKLYKKANK